MKNNTTNQNAMIAIVIGAILMIAGGYQAFNPVLAVSAHDDRADRQMLAITTFEMVGVAPTITTTWGDDPITSINEGEPVNVTCTWDYGGTTDYGMVRIVSWEPWTGLLDEVSASIPTGSHMFSVVTPLVNADTTNAKYMCILLDSAGTGIVNSYGHEYTILDVPNPPAQIDDTTDTLTLDKVSYNQGDTVMMTAWGENVGGETWLGEVDFIITQPDGTVYDVVSQYDISVTAGSSRTVTDSFSLLSTGQSGTWTIQSKWIDEDGNIHALSTIDLGTETIWGYDINVFGALIALIGLLIVGYGFSKRKS